MFVLARAKNNQPTPLGSKASAMVKGVPRDPNIDAQMTEIRSHLNPQSSKRSIQSVTGGLTHLTRSTFEKPESLSNSSLVVATSAQSLSSKHMRRVPLNPVFRLKPGEVLVSAMHSKGSQQSPCQGRLAPCQGVFHE
eukprot:5071598-Amphidinium_carterae.2